MKVILIIVIIFYCLIISTVSAFLGYQYGKSEAAPTDSPQETALIYIQAKLSLMESGMYVICENTNSPRLKRELREYLTTVREFDKQWTEKVEEAK